MSEVKRYNTELEKDGGLGLPSLTMRSSSIGSWVEYKDYAALEAKCASLSAQVELSIAAERAWERTMMQACGEDGPKSVADKFSELESKLETALRECRSAGITIDNLEAKCAALAAENDELKNGAIKAIEDIQCFYDSESWHVSEDGESETAVVALGDAKGSVEHFLLNVKTPATDAFLAEVRAQGVKMVADILKVAGVCEHTYLDASNDLAAKVRNEASSAKIHCSETATDNTNQQFESLSRGDK